MDSFVTNEVSVASLDILDRVFGGAPVVFFTAAAEDGYALTYVSRNIGRVLGACHEFCLETATFWRERVHPDDIGRVLDAFAGLPKAGNVTLEFRFRDDRNGYRWVSNDVAFRRDAVGGAAYLAGCLRDVGEEKKCSIEFANNLKEQNAREHFYRSVLDSVPQRLFWKDRNSVFRGCNLSGARALKLANSGEIAGKTDYDFYSDPNEANYLRFHDEQVMNSGLASFHTETPAREKDTWLDVSKVPLHDENGEVYGLLVCYEDVSALKKSEMALHKFRRAVEQSPNSIFFADVEGNIEHVNPSFLNVYGYEVHDVLGKNLRDLKPGIFPQDSYAGMWQAVIGGKSWKGELESQSGTGEIFWKACSLSPIFDESGRIIHLLGIENNITERKRIEKALAENEARLREITSTVGEGIYVVDINDVVTFINPAAVKLFGWNEQELLQRNVHDIFNCPQQDGQQRSDALPCCLFGGIKQTLEPASSDSMLFLRKDGTRFPASAIAAPILREGGYAGAVVAFHDISAQKHIQKLLHDTLHELRAVLDNAQIGVAYLRGGQFFWINRHMEQMFGYDGGWLLGKPMETIYAMDDDEPEESIGEISDLLGRGVVFENERLMKRCSGDLFWCHQRAAVIDPVDPNKGSIWIMMDIDRLKKTENTLKALNETLSQRVIEETQKSLERERLLIQQGRNAAMGEMIGNIAHQWRQPLSTLGLVVQNIHDDYRENTLDEDALEKYVATAQHAIGRMSCTIDDFRDFFRPNRAKECFSIHQSICGTLQLLEAMLKNNGIAVRLTGDNSLMALGHPNEYSQVILNFLANAKDALLERKVPQGRIEIEMEGRNGWGVVTVRDNAGGIPDGDLEKLFDPYFTTKPNGTGIGLHMNKTIIEKHMHGNIVCRNAPEGAEFVIAVPLAESAPINSSEVNKCLTLDWAI